MTLARREEGTVLDTTETEADGDLAHVGWF